MTGKRTIATVGLILTAAWMPNTFAGTGVHVTAVKGTFDDPGFATGFEGVSPAPPSLPQEAVFHGTSHVYGATMHGDVSYTLWGSPNPAGYFDFHTMEKFTGFVAGCGKGTMSYAVRGTATPYGPGDPTHQHLQAVWEIVQGTGSEGLAGVTSGGGTLDGTTDPTTANSGTVTGAIRCTNSSGHDAHA